MTPFRTSPTARLLSLAATILFTGGGVMLLSGVNTAVGIPLTLLLAIGCGIVAIILGVEEHTGEAVLASLLLPVGLWPYVMVMGYMADGHASLAWIPTLVGLLPFAATIVASRVGAPAAKPALAIDAAANRA